MKRKLIGRDSPLLLSAKYNTDEKNKDRKNWNTKYNINNKFYTKLKYFLNVGNDGAEVRGGQASEKRKQSKPTYAFNICVPFSPRWFCQLFRAGSSRAGLAVAMST